MELNWTTFLLETVNFLVLVWILKRFFYGPVKRIIAERRASIEKKIQDAGKTSTEAEGLRLKYENRLKDWEQEKARERESFQKGLEEEKSRQMKLLDVSLQKEKERLEAKEQKRISEILEKNEKEAVRQSLKFLSGLLATFACPGIEERIIELTLKAISEPASPEAVLLRSGFTGPKTEVKVQSAFALNEDQKRKLTSAFKNYPTEPAVSFEQRPELLAGLEVACGSVVLQANLRDELQAFGEVSGHD
jgi:F-type H+-transporting ATPase subunit b